MKKLLKKLVLIGVFGVCCNMGAISQVFIGLRDSRYVRIGYEYARYWSATLEHSVYAEKIGFQKIRAYLGFHYTWKNLSLSCQPYASTLWNADYQDYGVLVSADYRLFSLLKLGATLNPHYDSGYGYTTCFSAEAQVHIYKALSVAACYTTIPEYRLSEKRVKFGLDITVQRLSVTPLLSIPVGDGVKSLRISCNLNYKF